MVVTQPRNHRPLDIPTHSLAMLLFVSGCAALMYQLTWVRLLSLSMGSTSASVSTVLTAFFLGMTVGSMLAERLTRHRMEHLTVAILLEVIIGISGVLLLVILLHLDSLMALMPRVGASLLAKFLVTIVLLAVPTICMGATLPVMAALLVRQQQSMGRQISQLYSMNTAGAVLGAGSTGFVLIPWCGLDGTIYIACALNLGVALWGCWLNRRFSPPPLAASAAYEATPAQAVGTEALRSEALLVLFCTGAVAIATEVGWTKYLAIFTGATIYGFAAILMLFLSGIALGSWMIRTRLAALPSAAFGLTWGLLLLGASLLLARSGLALLPQAAGYTTALVSVAQAFTTDMNVALYLQQAAKFVLLAVLLGLPTVLFGAVFPVALTLYCHNVANVRQRLGMGYAVNTLGSILGAIGAGFWLIPSYGTDLLLLSMAVVPLCLSLLCCTVLSPTHQRLALISVLVLLLLGGRLLPRLDYPTLLTSVQTASVGQGSGERLWLFLKEGKAGVISLTTTDKKHASLQNNGLQESLLPLQEGVAPPLVETLLGLLPYFLHPAPKQAFVIGFGGGITVEALTATPLETIRVVELEPAVVDAVRTLFPTEIPALRDPRVQLSFHDARNTLLVERQAYDLIISQPSHPWLAGAGNLFTQRFFDIVRSRLQAEGIFVQWLNLFHMDTVTLQAIFRAFYDVFPHGFTFASASSHDLILLGASQPLLLDYDTIAQRMHEPAVRQRLKFWEFHDPQALLWYFALSRQEALTAAGDIPPNSDTRIVSEVRLARLLADPSGRHNPYALLEQHFHMDLAPYLKAEEAALVLYNAGRYSLQRQVPARAKHALAQLRQRHPALAQLLAQDPRWRP